MRAIYKKVMTAEQSEKKVRQEVTAFFNGDRIVLPKDDWTGPELREFFGVPSQNQLFKEEPGKHPDTVINPDTEIKVKNGDKFYDLPAGVKG